MLQHLPDLRQRNADADHLARDRVPQTMRPDPRDSRADAGPPDDRRDPATPERADRRSRSQEQLPPLALRPTALQIPSDRFAHSGGQRQPILTATLAVHHDLASMPVDIIERETRRLAGA